MKNLMVELEFSDSNFLESVGIKFETNLSRRNLRTISTEPIYWFTGEISRAIMKIYFKQSFVKQIFCRAPIISPSKPIVI